MTVHKNDMVHFDEVNCSALYCLPVSDAEFIFDEFPLNIDVKGYGGRVESIIQIDNIAYTFEKDYVSQVKITVSGVKIYGRQDSMPGYDIIRYKLYDSEEYMVASGGIYLDSLDQGDKFRDDSIVTGPKRI